MQIRIYYGNLKGVLPYFLLNVFPQNLHACLLPYAGSKFVYGSLIEPFYE
jgi:hypothetical protein